MDDEQRTRLRAAGRDIGIGFGSAVVLLALLSRGSLAAVELAVVAVAALALVWVIRTPVGRLTGASGRTVFGGLVAGLFISGGAVSMWPAISSVGSFLLLVVATATALLRRLAHR